MYSTELKKLLRGKTANQTRESVCNYDKVSAELKKLQGQAKGLIKVNEEFKILNDRIKASNDELSFSNKKMFEKITKLKAEKKLLLAASQQSLKTDSGIENEGDTIFEMRSISRESRKVDQRPRCLKRMKMKKRATRSHGHGKSPVSTEKKDSPDE